MTLMQVSAIFLALIGGILCGVTAEWMAINRIIAKIADVPDERHMKVFDRKPSPQMLGERSAVVLVLRQPVPHPRVQNELSCTRETPHLQVSLAKRNLRKA